ncbi:MAG: cysteine desulfurase family protein [Acidobacteriota bacterium]
MPSIYLDHATTTPIAPQVLEAMLPFLGERFGNPSSPHALGADARRGIEDARAAVAALLRASPEEILFTSSATEANNLAVKGLALARGIGRGHLVAAATEHISVLHPLRTLERWGYGLTLLPVDRSGRIDPDDLRRALRPTTILVSVAHASAEIGTLQPLAEICRVARGHGVPVHCDATLTTGHLPWPEGEDRPDLITAAPHLFYGPKGIGILRLRRGTRIAPLIEGGAQEGGLRAGTEAVAAAVGAGAAARLAMAEMGRRGARRRRLAGRLARLLDEHLRGFVWTGHRTDRVPGHLSLCVRGVEAEAMLSALDERGIVAASGSACTTEVLKASHVLEAIGLGPVLARGALTLSFGAVSRDGDPEEVAAALPPLVERLRSLSPIPTE